MVDPGVACLISDVHRLVVLHDPGCQAILAGSTRLHVEGLMDAVGRQRGEPPVGRIHDLDGDVVAGDQTAQSLGDALENVAGLEGGEDRLGDLEELPLAAQLALERQALVSEALRGIRIGHGLGGEARVDHEEPQVVVAELVEPELRENEDAQDLVVEEHRREEHRLVEVVLGPRDRVRSRIRGGIAQVLGDPVDRDPAGDPLAEGDPQLIRRLVDVLADPALHGHRDEVLVLQPVDADVVVVDELMQLGGDGDPDVGGAGEPIEAHAELLDGLELGRPGGHPVVVLGRPDRDAGLGRQLRHRVELGIRPRMRPIVIDVEQPQEGRAVPKRRRAQRVETLPDDRRAHAGTARVVAIADREERTIGLDRRGRQGPRREVTDAVEIAARQPAAHLGDDLAVAALEEDSGPGGVEQDHRLVDQPGQDPIEVEAAADVAADSPERLRAVAQAPDLGAALHGAHEGSETVGAGSGGLQILGPE